MSEPQMRMASDAEIEAVETMAAPFIDALQGLATPEAMKLLLYITARLILDMQPKPGVTHAEGFDQWAKAVRITIERNAALHNVVPS